MVQSNPSEDATSMPSHLGRYRLVRELGHGAMGVVYVADDEVLQQRVCIKTVHARLAHHPEIQARFMREVISARRIAHPQVCRVFDMHEDNGVRFLTMEYIEGRPVKALLKKGSPPLAVDRVLRMMAKLADGLAAAHALSVLHRDLKPGNVMLREGGDVDDDVVILDFGIAAVDGLAGLTQPGVMLGTPVYISPELWRGAPASPQSDLFALGVMMFKLLTQQLPWSQDDAATPLEAMATAAPPPSTLRPDIAPALDAIVARLLALSPLERFASAQALHEACIGALGAQSSSTTTVVLTAPLSPMPTMVTTASLPSTDEASWSGASASASASASTTASTTLPPRSAPLHGELGGSATVERSRLSDHTVPVIRPSDPPVRAPSQAPKKAPSTPPTTRLPRRPSAVVIGAIMGVTLLVGVGVIVGVASTPTETAAASPPAPSSTTTAEDTPLTQAIAAPYRHDAVASTGGEDDDDNPDVDAVDAVDDADADAAVASHARVKAKRQDARTSRDDGGVRRVRTAMRKKGILAGDSPAVDAALAQARAQLKKGDVAAATRAANNAEQALTAVQIDRAFLDRKLRRLNARYDLTTPRTKALLDEHADEAARAIAAGNFAAANATLNEGFKHLDG